VEGYCTNCSRDTVQTVLKVEGLQIRSVRCEKCAGEGPFRMPRARTKAALMEVAAKRRSTEPPRRTRRKREDPGQTFRKLLEGKDLASAIPYAATAIVDIGRVIKHPVFGLGVVTTMTEPSKATITFEDGVRVMACKRK
jgi:hypothetical protein